MVVLHRGFERPTRSSYCFAFLALLVYAAVQVQLAYRCALVLRDLINPYLLRRQKKDVDEVKRWVKHMVFPRT